MLKRIIEAAQGRLAVDLLLRGGNVVNVFTQEIEEADVALLDGLIVGVYPRITGQQPAISAAKIIDLDGGFVAPGLIDAHIHIESSLLTPPAFAQAVVPHGTTAVITDPHEIGNVLGIRGIQGMDRLADGLPINMYMMVPSCVPATHMETSGAQLTAADIQWVLEHLPGAIGLAEVMNFPGVVAGEPEILDKLEAAKAKGLPIDGHAPGLTGTGLHAYIAAGIASDHECTNLKEAWEKLRRGMHLLIREGTAAKNLAELIPCITPHTAERISFCSDDRHPEDLISEGHMDAVLRKAVSLGVDPLLAIKMATLTTARHYGLPKLGAVAPGYRGDLAVFEDLRDFKAQAVFKDGRPVATQGKLISSHHPSAEALQSMTQTVRLPEVVGRLIPKLRPDDTVRIIQVQPNQIVTSYQFGCAKDIGPENDLLYIAVVERHGVSGSIGVGLVRGFGLKDGALASTVAHDSHNLIVIGTNEKDMEKACQTVAHLGGGLAVVAGGQVKATLALPVAGLMSNETAETVAAGLQAVNQAARDLGCQLDAPMMTMSFLALPVIPELKLTDHGLIDVNCFSRVPLRVSPIDSV